jgi:hypothetical protein
MSAKKADMSAHEPSWAEVILGAVLSAALGVVLGVVFMALKPLAAVKEMPKEPVAGTIYYIQGSHDSKKATQAAGKRKAFAAGGSITATEDEINSFLPPPPPLSTAKPKAGEKKAAPAAAAPKVAEKGKAGEKASAPASTGELLALGGPNFHIANGTVQIAVPVTLNVLGLEQSVTVLATGNFVKKDASFAFQPDTLYFGSCPMQRLPFAAGFVANKVLAAQPIPDDVAAAWPKLASVAVEGNALKLTMP